MEATRVLKIRNEFISNKGELEEFVRYRGKEGVCKHQPYTLCVRISTNLYTNTGQILWANIFGNLISAEGYEYELSQFI